MKEKVFLALLPYWTPQIPPLGISCLKSAVISKGYEAKAVDFNVDNKLREIYNEYFDMLRGYVTANKQGNFYNIGHEVLQNHFMAHLHYDDEEEYIELVKVLIANTFFIDVDHQQVARLNESVCRFYDCLEERFFAQFDEAQPTILGLSAYKGNLPASVFIFKRTREKYPHVKTVMGGAIFAQNLCKGTPDYDYFLETTRDYIDHLIIGEGEALLLNLLEGKFSKSQRVLTDKDLEAKTIDLSRVTVPDFTDFDLSVYPMMASYTSRSCQYQCHFCTETVYWGKFRKKDMKQVVKELGQLYKKHNYQLFLLCDSLLNAVITPLAKEMIKSGPSIYWDGYLRASKIVSKPEMAQLWRQGGYYRARLGVESGSDRMLKKMNKMTDVAEIKASVSSLASAGIKTTTYWIIGYPGETEEDFQQTLDLIEELKDDLYEAECNPFGYYLTGQAGTDFFAKTYGASKLYPEEATKMLILQSWGLNCEPRREEVFSRISRFVDHCNRLGISNPYSLYDISKADERWKKLHPNAVPGLVNFRNKDHYIDENKRIVQTVKAQNTMEGAVEFGF